MRELFTAWEELPKSSYLVLFFLPSSFLASVGRAGKGPVFRGFSSGLMGRVPGGVTDEFFVVSGYFVAVPRPGDGVPGGLSVFPKDVPPGEGACAELPGAPAWALPRGRSLSPLGLPPEARDRTPREAFPGFGRPGTATSVFWLLGEGGLLCRLGRGLDLGSRRRVHRHGFDSLGGHHAFRGGQHGRVGNVGDVGHIRDIGDVIDNGSVLHHGTRRKRGPTGITSDDQVDAQIEPVRVIAILPARW